MSDKENLQSFLANQPFLQALLSDEPLHADLEPHVCETGSGTMIHHPLVVDFYTPAMNARYNLQYLAKRTSCEEAMQERKWSSYIFLHERPYRLEALQRCIKAGVSAEEYWPLVASVWTESENIHEHLRTWRTLWTSDVPNRLGGVMDEDDAKAYADLPDTIPIWRGVNVKAGQRGMSWTTNKDRAEWFAHRFAFMRGRTPYLAAGLVAKQDVLAVFLGRNEEEVVVLPEKVQSLAVNRLQRRKPAAL